MNKFFKRKLFLFLAKIIAPPLLMLYRYSLSIKIYHGNFVLGCHQRGEKIIYSVWHENLILGLLVHKKQGVYVLVSQHFDGEIIANILKAFGYKSIRGSSTRGGKEAFAQMKQKMERKQTEVAFTPDGPRGPRREVKVGIVRLASETGAPIIPMAVAASRFKRLNSWDRLLIILPFSRCTLVYHEPIYVPANINSEKLKEHARQLTVITNELEKEAERCLAG
jgi:lysophospholipid acyltransferase (LPLAT)-like uncharacterized protein